MASPQLENGHTRVANEILEKLSRVDLGGIAFRVVIAVLRFTYGFQRKTAVMSLNFTANHIQAPRRSVIRAFNELKEKGIITRDENGNTAFEKNYDSWAGGDKNDTRDKSDPRDENDTRMVTKMTPHLVTELSPKKENIKKTLNKTLTAYSAEFETFWSAYPQKKEKAKAFEAWKRSGINGDLQKVLASVEEHKLTRKWHEGFVVYPERFLKRRLWEDVITAQEIFKQESLPIPKGWSYDQD